MSKKTGGFDSGGRDTETNDEIVGVLTAISVVSKRLARRLTMLDMPNTEGGTNENDKSRIPENAD